MFIANFVPRPGNATGHEDFSFVAQTVEGAKAEIARRFNAEHVEAWEPQLNVVGTAWHESDLHDGGGYTYSVTERDTTGTRWMSRVHHGGILCIKPIKFIAG